MSHSLHLRDNLGSPVYKFSGIGLLVIFLLFNLLSLSDVLLLHTRKLPSPSVQDEFLFSTCLSSDQRMPTPVLQALLEDLAY